MNRCEDRHIPKYKITYKPAKGKNYCPEWFVCEHCCEKGPFGSDALIDTLEIIPPELVT